MALKSWQRNLAASFLAELLAMTAFTFVDPLIPLYIQKVGNLTVEHAAFWAGITASSLGIIMFFISPVWGVLADRFGRKLMVLRAMFGGAIVLTLLGFAPNIYAIVILRGLQGLVTGSVAAATALASGIAPREKMSFAMGTIMLAVFGGQSIGPVIGGYIADNFGYQVTFLLSGSFLLAGGIIVLLLVKENFQKPEQGKRMSLGDSLRLAFSREMFPLLAIMCFLSIGQSIINPIISLRVKEINDIGKAATTSGIIFSLMGVMAAISSMVGGRLGERISLPRILMFSCIAIGLLFLPLGWASKITIFALFLILTGLFRGGQATSTNSMVGLSVSVERQGIAYGLAQSANSLGGGLGPLIGGSLAQAFGLRPIFAISSGVFIIAGFLVWRVLGKRYAAPPPKPSWTST